MKTIKTRIAILGAGPAGMAAAVEAENNRMDFVLIDNQEPGWYAKYSINQHYTIDGYLGAYNTTGQQLVELFNKHLQTKGIPVMKEEVKNVIRKGKSFIITCNDVLITSEFLILATGSKPKKLEIDNYDKFFGNYIFNFVCKERVNLNGKNVIVIGGRNSGTTTAIYISRETTAHVTLIEKDSKLNATTKYIERLKNTRVKCMVGANIFKITGNEKIEEIAVNLENGKKVNIPADYIFCCIGMEPNYEFLKCDIEKDYAGRIVVNPKTMEAGEKLYAIGDINNLNPKQVANATANGKTAVYYINRNY